MYPVAFEADFVEERSRLSTFFRLILTIPWMIVAIFWGIGALLATIGAWFAIVFTGRYPQGLYDFNAKALRYYARVDAFQHLMTDEFPPFDGGEHPEYPTRVEIAAPLAQYSRAKAFFRIILFIPIMIVLYLMVLLERAIGILSWLVIVVLGRQPKGLFDVTKLCIAYQTRAMAYYWLVTESYPPLSADDDGGSQPAGAVPAAG